MFGWIKRRLRTNSEDNFKIIANDLAIPFIDSAVDQAKTFQAIIDRIPIENRVETNPSQLLQDDALAISFHLLCRAVNSIVGPKRRYEFINILLNELCESLPNQYNKSMSEIVSALNDRDLEFSKYRMTPIDGNSSPKGTLSWEAAKSIASKHDETNPAAIFLISHSIGTLYILYFDTLKQVNLK